MTLTGTDIEAAKICRSYIADMMNVSSSKVHRVGSKLLFLLFEALLRMIVGLGFYIDRQINDEMSIWTWFVVQIWCLIVVIMTRLCQEHEECSVLVVSK